MRRERGYKARLRPTGDQADALGAQGHVARMTWNLLHDWWTMSSENRRVSPAAAEQAMRQGRTDIDWMTEIPAEAAEAVITSYFRAWADSRAGRAEAPAFKPLLLRRLSFDVPRGRDLGIRRVNPWWGEVAIPRVGAVRFRWIKGLPVGKRADARTAITGARLVCDARGWHVVFHVQTGVEGSVPHTGNAETAGIAYGDAEPYRRP